MSKYQSFEMKTINRKEINLAEYNPRKIDPENKKRLKKGIKDNGLVEPLVWNSRTKRLVSGHQRLSIIDQLEKSQDYEIDVAVIDVDEETEKKLNVQLNNSSMQGFFDFEMLGDMAIDSGIELEDFGFSEFDVEMMFGTNDKYQELLPDTPAVENTKTELQEIKAVRNEMNEKYSKEQNADFYFIVVCKDQREKDDLLTKMSVPVTEKFLTSLQLKRLSQN